MAARKKGSTKVFSRNLFQIPGNSWQVNPDLIRGQYDDPKNCVRSSLPSASTFNFPFPGDVWIVK